jgi:hypothetical protein
MTMSDFLPTVSPGAAAFVTTAAVVGQGPVAARADLQQLLPLWLPLSCLFCLQHSNRTLWPMQERATKISHGNTARLAMQHGDTLLGKICGTIAVCLCHWHCSDMARSVCWFLMHASTLCDQ